jgi:hypothetical protein
MILASFRDPGGTGSGDEDIPAGYGFQAESGDLADILLVIDDQNAT